MKKRVLVDATALSDQYKGRGIGTYALNLIRRLIQDKNYDWHLIGFEDVKNKFSNITFHSLGEVELSTPKNFLLFRRNYIPVIKKVKPDLYFAPHFERGLPLGICKIAVALHDISPYLFKKYSSKGTIANFLKGLVYKYNLNRAKKADIIITISNFTKSELVRAGLDKNKISVTYLGLSEDFDLETLKKVKDRKKVLEKYNIKKPYLLYYGGLEPNKNVDKLLEVFKIIMKKIKVKLVILDKNLYREGNQILAKSRRAEEIKRIIRELDIENDIILSKFVKWKDLPIVLNESEAFVHLSSYEGFGLGCLEAMAAGSPVIAADKSCYPEIHGSAAVLVDPNNIKKVSEEVMKIIKEPGLKRELSNKGIKQSKKYSWEKCAKRTLEAFEAVL